MKINLLLERILLIMIMLLYVNHMCLVMHALKLGGQFVSIDAFVDVIFFGFLFFFTSIS